MSREWKGLNTKLMPVFLGYDQTERMIAALLDRAARWQPDVVVGIVRGGLVPATMELLGDKNWWLPGWLDRLLPTINVEGHVDAGSEEGPDPERELTGAATR